MSAAAENFSPSPKTELTLTSRQQSVADALAHRQTTKYQLSRWYVGAIRTLANELNPDCQSQAAHSLRELMEKLPQVMQGEPFVVKTNYKALRKKIQIHLSRENQDYRTCAWEGLTVGPNLAKALKEVVSYLEKNEMPGRENHVVSSITSLDPMFSSFSPEISQKKTELYNSVWSALQKETHHGFAETHIRVCLEQIEELILEIVAPVAESDRQAMLAMLKAGPTTSDAAKQMGSLVTKRGANFVLFFQKVDDPGWLTHIEAAGFFAHPPPSEPQDQDHTRWPFWWPVTILSKLVIKSEEEVVRIALRIPKTENPQVLHEITQVALQAPTVKQSLLLAPRVHDFIQHRQPWQALHIGEALVEKWSEPDSPDAINAAVNLARSLLALDQIKNDENETHLRAHGRFMARCEPREYRQFVEGCLMKLARVAPMKVTAMIGNKLRKIVRIENGVGPGQPVPWKDKSNYWCLDVAHRGLYDEDARALLVTALAESTEHAVGANPGITQEIVTLLRRQPSQIFSRVLWHLAAKRADALKVVIAEEIIKAPYYANEVYDAEFHDMVRAGFRAHGVELLSKDQRAVIFEKILAGPSREEYEKFHGPEDTEKFWEGFRQNFILRQLAPFSEVLFGRFAEAFDVLSDHGHNVPAAESYRHRIEGRGGTVEQRSPKTVEDLAAMDDESLLGFLNSWKEVGLHKGDFLIEISLLGLANAFGAVLESDPTRFAAWRDRWKRLVRPIYVGAALTTAEKLVRAGRHDTIPAWLALCRQVVEQPGMVPESGNATSGDSPNWTSIRRNVCDFLEAAVDSKQPISQDHRDVVWKLLEVLVLGDDPELEEAYDPNSGLGRPYSVAINRSRSRAIEVAFDTAVWSDDVSPLNRLLEARFKGKPPLSLPEHALLVINFPRIVALDQQWATEHIGAFFPRKPSEKWQVLFAEYLVHTRAFIDLWPLLKDEFDHALNNFPAFVSRSSDNQRDQVAAMGQYLFFYYVHGLAPLSGADSLLQRYLRQAGKKKRAGLFGHIGHMLDHAGSLSPDIRERIELFFAQRESARDSNELENFTLWLGSKCLAPKWRLNAYLQLLNKPDGNGSYFSETGTLAELVTEEPGLVLTCFEKITASAHRQRHFYLKKEDVQVILRAGLSSLVASIRQSAELSRDNLIKIGQSDYLDGLETQTID